MIFSSETDFSNPLIGPDGSLYGWSYNARTRVAGLTALTATGSQRWTVPLSQTEGGPPTLTPQRLMLANGRDASGQAIIALTMDNGRRSWTVRSLPWTTGIHGVPNSKAFAPLVTAAGLLYMPFVGPDFNGQGDNQGLEVVSPSGAPLRVLQPGVSANVAMARDGTVYELGGRCCTGPGSLTALTPKGVRRWTRTLGFAFGSALLAGMRGILYVSDSTGIGPGHPGEVGAYAPSSRRRWRLHTTDGEAVLAERADGTVLVATATSLSAVSPQGKRMWRRTLGRLTPAEAAAPTLPSLAVDVAGRVYVGSNDGMVRAIGSDGALLWTVSVGGPGPSSGSPSLALGPDGRLVVAGTDGHLRVYR